MLRTGHIGLATLLALTAGWDGTALAAGDHRSGETTARVTANSLNLRSAPSTGGAVVRALPRGTEVVVLAAQEDWSQVRLADGATGWVATRYLEILPGEAPAAGRKAPSQPGEVRTSPVPAPSEGAAKHGGVSLRAVAKWGCLAGAVAAGGLWYVSHSEGNDAYDEYKRLFGEGEFVAAEAKYDEALDQDDKARVYAIAGGALAGLFLLQQFVLKPHAGGPPSHSLVPDLSRVRVSPRGEVRVELVRIRS